MADVYRIFGAELSPYSVKVRSYFRYKNIPHEWIQRGTSNQAEFDKHAKLPLIPLVIAPDGTAMQDSTPIIERIEARFPQPSIHPEEPVSRFVSALIEEYGDEWGNKPMFHYRWFYEPDQLAGAERIARGMNPDLGDDMLPNVVEMVKARMIPRLKFVGSSVETKDQIEGSFRRQLAVLETHLADRPYLFGGRPSFGDFGWWAQLYECSIDPTPGAIMKAEAPRTMAWIERMLSPKREGEWEPWDRLEDTLMPLLRDEIAGVFLPWSIANAIALAAGDKTFSLHLGGKPFSQETQKYHARSLGALRKRFADESDHAGLADVLARAGCLEGLRG